MGNLFDIALELEGLMPLVVQSLFHSPSDPMAAMPLGQLRIVRALMAGPTTSSCLAKRFGLTKAAVSQLVRRLVKSGMVTQTRGAQDARVKLLQLTPEALSLMTERSRLRAAHAVGVLSTFSPEEVSEFRELLDRCVHLPQLSA